MPQIKFFWENPVDLAKLRVSWEAAFLRVLPENEWNNIWRWRFEENPLSQDVLAAYVEEDGIIACFYAVSPLVILLPDGSQLKSALMNTGFTHPKFQGKGYYLEMNKQMHLRLERLGFQLLIGFANSNSHYSYRKYLGWQDIALLTNFRLLNDHNHQAVFIRNNMVSSLSLLTEDVVDKMSRCFVASNLYQVERSFQYLKWRLLNHPIIKYRCLITVNGDQEIAFAVVKPFQNTEIDILEIFYTSINAGDMHSVLASIVSCLTSEGFSTINMWSNLFSDEHLTLEKLGFREHKATTHFGTIDFSGLEDVANVRRWHYRFLDSDVY